MNTNLRACTHTHKHACAEMYVPHHRTYMQRWRHQVAAATKRGGAEGLLGGKSERTCKGALDRMEWHTQNPSASHLESSESPGHLCQWSRCQLNLQALARSLAPLVNKSGQCWEPGHEHRSSTSQKFQRDGSRSFSSRRRSSKVDQVHLKRLVAQRHEKPVRKYSVVTNMLSC